MLNEDSVLSNNDDVERVKVLYYENYWDKYIEDLRNSYSFKEKFKKTINKILDYLSVDVNRCNRISSKDSQQTLDLDSIINSVFEYYIDYFHKYRKVN